MSVALEEWGGPSSLALDEIELLYWGVEFAGSGVPALAEQIDHAYVTLLVAHFQRYCRGVYTEAAQALATVVTEKPLQAVVKGLFKQGCLLERGNPTPTALGSDFGRFGIRFWMEIEADDRLNRRRKRQLEELCEWRNGITHGDLPRKQAAGLLVPADMSLETCREWREALRALVISIDKVTAARCRVLGCPEPW